MLVDRYGLPVSTTSVTAIEAYVAGADCVLAAVTGAGEHLEQAIRADPEFALAHIALARALSRGRRPLGTGQRHPRSRIGGPCHGP